MLGCYLCALFKRAPDPLAVDVEARSRCGGRVLIIDGNRIQHPSHGGRTICAHGTTQRTMTGRRRHMDRIVVAELPEHVLLQRTDTFAVALESLPGQPSVGNTARRHINLTVAAPLTIASTQNLTWRTVTLASKSHYTRHSDFRAGIKTPPPLGECRQRHLQFLLLF